MHSVYVVDDHEDTAESTRILLKVYGFDAIAYTCPEYALRQIVSDHPCVIFLDYHLKSKMSAIEFIKHVRELKNGTKIVIVSGDHRAENLARSLNVDFMLKPVEPDAIEMVVAKHCPKSE